jgi:nicotinamidase/pyrazinamidase
MKTVFLDVDTQIDFMLPSGALYVPGAERIIAAVARLNRRAEATGAQLISTTDAHFEDDPEFGGWPPHCVVGTMGQRKPAATLLARQAVVPATGVTGPVGGAPQWIVEKRALDCFTNPSLDGILAALNPDRCVVYGVVTEICVRLAAEGLLARNRQVMIVTDATRALNAETARAAMAGWAARGAVLTTVAEVSGLRES